MGDALDTAVRRGSAEVLILSLLEASDRHGYEIAKLIEAQSHGVVRFHVALGARLWQTSLA
jgi:PadR family transcriptional regulator, regulatory protein PadR